MTDFDKIRKLFQTALERDGEERFAFLDEACGGDASLRAEVECLLEAHEKAPEFPEKPAWSQFVLPASKDGDEEDGIEVEEGLPFDRLGDFRVIRRLGEGGMGVVYLALQESLGRQVALKVIRPERVGSFEVESRFAREAGAVAKLRHPNIITVLESGEDKGVRYFAMELMPGEGLDRVLAEARYRQEKTPTPTILGWIRDTALALECAHQAGIIHRDVKPSNIQITPDGRPLLMDFGVARHVDLASLTLTGEFRGTPYYASPEQVSARSRKIDARSDIYSLGVTLYEAVTGQVPFRGETTSQVFHQILEREPVAPRRLNPAISRDLETVIVTAMEKDPDRRYQRMADFADDIERVLNGEMILAKPAGFATRVWKRIRRYPLVSTALGASLLVLLSAVVYVLFWAYPQVMQERDNALNAQIRAESETRKTKAVYDFLARMLTSADPRQVDKDVKVVDVLDRASLDVAVSFPDDWEIAALLHNTIGRTYQGLGRNDEAVKQHAAALEIYTREFGQENLDTLSTMSALFVAYKEQGNHAEAEALVRKELEIERRILGPDHERALQSAHNLGAVLSDQKKFAEAEPLIRQALEGRLRLFGERGRMTLFSKTNLANVLMAQKKCAEAEALLREVLEAQETLYEKDHTDRLSTMNNLVALLVSQGKFAEAEPVSREVLASRRRVLGDEHYNTQKSLNNLIVVLLRQGRNSEAIPFIQELLAIRRRVLGDDHKITLKTMDQFVGLLSTTGRLGEYEPLLQEVIDTFRRFRGDEHDRTLFIRDYLGQLRQEQERYAEAEAIHREQLDIKLRHFGRVHKRTFLSMKWMGAALRSQGKLEEAEPFFREAFDVAGRVYGNEHPETLGAIENLAVVLMTLSRFSEAEELLAESLAIAGEQTTRGDTRRARLNVKRAECLIVLKRFDEAETCLLPAYEEMKAELGEADRSTRIALEVLVKLYDSWQKPRKAEEYRGRNQTADEEGEEP